MTDLKLVAKAPVLNLVVESPAYLALLAELSAKYAKPAPQKEAA